MMSNIDEFREMIMSLESNILSELCEQFLHDHEGAMKKLCEFCSKFELSINYADIKEFMMTMQLNGEFDDVICYGIELGSNDLYKKFHPSE